MYTSQVACFFYLCEGLAFNEMSSWNAAPQEKCWSFSFFKRVNKSILLNLCVCAEGCNSGHRRFVFGREHRRGFNAGAIRAASGNHAGIR